VLSPELRTAILQMAERGMAKRAIARELGISRVSVRQVLRSKQVRPPGLERASKLEVQRDEILELHRTCRGNLVRVHEELAARGVEIAYPTLTAFCRREGIGQKPKQAVGRYPFVAGKELQHDTSPHRVEIGGRQRDVQTASSVLPFSANLFFECFPRFRRFECKVHLTHAVTYFDGSPGQVMIDNTHVIVLRGTGASMVPVPEMAAFGQRLGFAFVAHEKGDANRSAHVERGFDFIENNFFPGRTFCDFEDLNAQGREWCDRVVQRYISSRRARPVELFAIERHHLAPLPRWLPEPYQSAWRIVDVEGYVRFDNHHYSVFEAWIGREVRVRATLEKVTVEPPRGSDKWKKEAEEVEHRRILLPEPSRITLPEHRRSRRRKPTTDEELERIEQLAPEILDYARDLRRCTSKQPTIVLRHLLRMIREYPRQPLADAVREAHHYGLYELHRLDSMILRRIGADYFRFDEGREDDDER
jgi:transposase